MAHAYATKAASIPASDGPSAYAYAAQEWRFHERRKSDPQFFIALLVVAILICAAALATHLGAGSPIRSLRVNGERLNVSGDVQIQAAGDIDITREGDVTTITVKRSKQ